MAGTALAQTAAVPPVTVPGGTGSTLSAPSANVPSGADPGITAVPSPSAPPPVVTVPTPSSPVLPQTTYGGQYATYPLAPPVPPVSAPNPPSVSNPQPLPNPAATLPPVTRRSQSAAVIQGPQTPKGLGSAQPVAAGGLDLVEAYRLGTGHDATYRAGLAERDVNRETANQTIAAYLPTASYTYSNIPTEGGARHVATVTQPLLSASGLATIRQRGPRRRYADATLEVRAQDLATRTLTAITDIIKANEATTFNDAKIEALKTQSNRAERLYKGGQGTITDARDIQVRYEQALANQPLLASDQIAATTRLRSITGAPVPVEAFRLPAQFGPIELDSVDAYLAEQSQDNPQVAAARETERINQLEAQRVRGTILPVVGLSATYTRRDGVADSYVGLSVSAPFNAGSLFQSGSAYATARRSAEERRQVEDKAHTELERLYAMVRGGRDALVINARAIEAAELSVEANSKSYEGGVRTNVDVVNAIQTVFEVKNAYVTSAAALASNYLNLLLLAGIEPEDALAATQKFLLGR